MLVGWRAAVFLHKYQNETVDQLADESGKAF